jgi:cobalt/nickel transport system permease protein
MGAGHSTTLYRPGTSPVHRLPAHCKIVAVVAFVFAVVSTPRDAYWAFAVYALLLGGTVALARLPVGTVLRRMAIELPFVGFALLLPFVASGPEVEVLGVGLSESGLTSAFNVLAKATLGVLASIVLASTTEIRDILHGLERLRMPHQLVLIASFTIRYMDVVSDELARMRIARAARGFQARGVRSWPVLARTLGALFLRSYERGERVHLAMRSRGFAGRMPVLQATPAGTAAWASALLLPAAAIAVAATAVLG